MPNRGSNITPMQKVKAQASLCNRSLTRASTVRLHNKLARDGFRQTPKDPKKKPRDHKAPPFCVTSLSSNRAVYFMKNILMAQYCGL